MAGQSGVEGGRELEEALTLLPDRVAQRVTKGALRAGARVIAKEARELAPKASGDFARAIVVKAPTVRQRRRGAALIVIGVLRPWARIAHLLEFGWRFSAARPFLRPAVDRKGGEAVRVIAARMRRGIENEVRKLRRRRTGQG